MDELTSVGSAYEADLLAGRLREAGISVETNRSTAAPGAWVSSVGNPAGPIEIHVPAEDADKARDLLRDVEPVTQAPSGPRGHRKVQLIGRVLIGLALLAAVVGLLIDAVR